MSLSSLSHPRALSESAWFAPCLIAEWFGADSPAVESPPSHSSSTFFHSKSRLGHEVSVGDRDFPESRKLPHILGQKKRLCIPETAYVRPNAEQSFNDPAPTVLNLPSLLRFLSWFRLNKIYAALDFFLQTTTPRAYISSSRESRAPQATNATVLVTQRTS
jgi:hypothetical protein